MTPSPLSELLATGISYNFLLVSGVSIIVLCAISSLVPFLLLDQSAFATFPGEKGKIAFTSMRDGNAEIYVMNTDGSEPINISNNPSADSSPSWSPDGTKIAFLSDRESYTNNDLYIMNADGSDVRRLTGSSPTHEDDPVWSPDGTKIAFVSYRDDPNNAEIYVMNTDGSDVRRLTNSPFVDTEPDWSPDGTKIAFSSDRPSIPGTYGNRDIYTMNTDGSDVRRLTTDPSTEAKPSWSPDGTKIAFWGREASDIYVMNTDGSDVRRVTTNPDTDYDPSWSPDGTKIAFVTSRHQEGGEIYIINQDGTGETNASNNPYTDLHPGWGTNVASPPEEDTTAPVLTLPADITADATTANGGTVVRYTVTAQDNVDGIATLEEDNTITQDVGNGGNVTVSCSPSSGFEFPIGETTIHCSAIDEAGNEATGSFMVIVNPPPPDTTAPIITIPEDMTVEATGPDGAEVSFEQPSAIDDVDGPVDVTCDYDSGDTFPIGGTVVTCSAEDSAGNRAEETFTITIQDTTDPDVEITQVVDRRNRILDEGDTTPTPYIRITFEATDAVGVEDIECNFDGQGFTSCTSPVVYDRLSRGTHQVTVRAIDEAGNNGEDQFLFTVGSPPSSAVAPGRQ